MKLRIERDGFAQAVEWSAHALPHRSPVPALGGLLLAADAGAQRLTVSGFDYEVSARFEAEAEVFEPGSVLVPGRLLADLARALPDQPVELSTDATEGGEVLVVCGPVQFALPEIPREDYPRLPELPPVLGSVDGPAFAEAVAQVAVVAGRDEALPFLTGVRIELRGEVLRLVATDRYRLAVRELAWEPAQDAPAPDAPARETVTPEAVALETVTPEAVAPEAVALVPAKSLYELARSLQKGERIALALTSEGDVADRSVGGGLIGFRAGARQATTRLLAGEFITYQRIFPSAYTGEVVVERQALLEAVKRISLVAERHLPVLLALEPDRLLVTAGSGGEARGRQELAAHYAGEPMVLAANAAWLTEGLGVLGTPFARLSFTTPTKPAVLTPCQSPEESSASGSGALAADYRYLFMPQRSSGRA